MVFGTGIEGVDEAGKIYREKLYAKGGKLSGPTGPMHLENTVGGEQADPAMNPEEVFLDKEDRGSRGFDIDDFIDKAFEKYPDKEIPERSEITADPDDEQDED